MYDCCVLLYLSELMIPESGERHHVCQGGIPLLSQISLVPNLTCPKSHSSQALVEGGGKSWYERKQMWHTSLLTRRKTDEFPFKKQLVYI